jgi:DNA-binding response OmpR family regulator
MISQSDVIQRGSLVSTIKIVCIDDKPEMVELVRLILAKRNYEFYAAGDGREGLTLVNQVLPDLVLLDLMMPDMDGWEVFNKMKAEANTADIPIIILTARGQSIDKVLGLHIAKVDDYITKPFSPQELLGAIERVLNPSASGSTSNISDSPSPA